MFTLSREVLQTAHCLSFKEGENTQVVGCFLGFLPDGKVKIEVRKVWSYV